MKGCAEILRCSRSQRGAHRLMYRASIIIHSIAVRAELLPVLHAASGGGLRGSSDWNASFASRHVRSTRKRRG